MGAVQQHYDTERDMTESFAKVFPNAFEANLLLNNDSAAAALVELLEDIFKDDDLFIQYFIWELDFGKRAAEYPIEIYGKVIKLPTVKDLYKLLKKIKKNEKR